MSKRTKRFSCVESLETRNLLSATTIETEPNDRESSADVADFSTGQAILEGVSTSDDDKDFFVLTVPSTGQIDVEVNSGNGEFAQVEVKDAAGRDRFESEPNDGFNSGSFAATAGEQLYFRLRAKGDAPTQYSVNVEAANGGEVTPVDPSNPITSGSDDGTPDQGSGDAPGTPGTDGVVTNPPDITGAGSLVSESEVNDRQSQADAFSLDVTGNATLTGVSQSDGDKDFFVFTPAESGLLNVSVESGNGNFAQLEIETLAGVSIFETEPNDGINNGSVSVTGGAIYFVRLRSKTDGSADYTANLSMSSGTVTPDSGNGGPTTPAPGNILTGIIVESEVNDRMAQSDRFALDARGKATLQGTSLNDDDKDYFAFTAPADGLLSINVNSPNGNVAQAQVENALGLELFDTEPNDGINNGSVEVAGGQDVFVRMRSKTDGPAEYAVDLVFAEGASRVMGDANGDGNVGFSDFLRLSRFFGRDDCDFDHGDFDGDSSVTFNDFLILSKSM